jgi:hypothetical protein
MERLLARGQTEIAIGHTTSDRDDIPFAPFSRTSADTFSDRATIFFMAVVIAFVNAALWAGLVRLLLDSPSTLVLSVIASATWVCTFLIMMALSVSKE